MSAIKVVGRVNGTLILTIIYFLVFPPFSLYLMIVKDRTRSGWKMKEPYPPNSHENQY